MIPLWRYEAGKSRNSCVDILLTKCEKNCWTIPLPSWSHRIAGTAPPLELPWWTHTQTHYANRLTYKFTLNARMCVQTSYLWGTDNQDTFKIPDKPNLMKINFHGSHMNNSEWELCQNLCPKGYPNCKSIHPSPMAQIRIASSGDFYPIRPGKLKSEDLSKWPGIGSS